MREMKYSGVPWIGNIPEDWALVSVKRLFSIGRGRVIAQTELDETGYPVYSSQTKDNGCLGYIDTYDYDYPQLTWTTDGANAGSIFLRDGYYNCTNVCGTLNPIVDLVDLRYQKYALEHIAYNERRIDTNGYKIMNNEMAIIKTLLPPLSIQHHIADYLDTKCTQIDTIIAKEQSVIEKLQEYKQSVITEAVTKGLEPKVDMIESNISWLKTIPVTWKVSKLKYVAEFSPKCDFTDIKPDTEVTYTPMEYIKKGNYIPNSEAIGKLSTSLTKYEEGDIVIAKVTPCFENGNIAIMDNLKSGKGLGSSELFVFRVPEAIRKFVFYWMQNKLFIEQCVATMTGTGGLKRVSSNYISNSEIFLPPPEMIDDICNYLDKKCDLIEQTIRQKELVIGKLTEYKKSLIYEVVTGKKEVPHV